MEDYKELIILVVEDDEGLSELVRDKIEECGYKTAAVYSAAKAIEWLTMNTVYIMLLDYTLPDMNAKEFIAELRHKGLSLPSFIVATGRGDERIAVDMMKLGARDYIVKDRNFLDMLPGVVRRVDKEIENEDKLKKTEMALRESQSNMSLFLRYCPNPVFIKDENTRTILLSNHFETMLEKPLSQLLGKTNEEIWPPEIASAMSADDKKVMEEGCTVEVEESLDGKYFLTKKFPILMPDRPTWMGGFTIDITELKLAEEKIRSLLAEKELILKEVHHRIKNNMNTIKSLLFLQADTLKDQSAVSALHDAESRVESMMVLYDKLYRSTDVRELSIKEYLMELVDEIIGNFPNQKIVKIHKHIDDFVLSAGILFSIGIIVNELLTNIMKYAFSGRDSGAITVSASKKDNIATIVIQDNGVGIPDSIGFEKSSGFGLDLVGMLTQQIGGIIKIERGEGTKFVMEFGL